MKLSSTPAKKWIQGRQNWNLRKQTWSFKLGIKGNGVVWERKGNRNPRRVAENPEGTQGAFQDPHGHCPSCPAFQRLTVSWCQLKAKKKKTDLAILSLSFFVFFYGQSVTFYITEKESVH